MPSNAFQMPHRGEIAARRRFNDGGAPEAPFAFFRDRLTADMGAFMERQLFFFIATADECGACDCSFRGRQHTPPAAPEPLLRVVDATTIEFPDYPGNRLFNSLGNLLVNPRIGMLFVDFAQQRRLRVNGTVEVLESRAAGDSWWPSAPRLVRVTITQAFPNCPARIPALVPA